MKSRVGQRPGNPEGTKSPWGSVIEAEVDRSPWGRPVPPRPVRKPTVTDFREVGMTEADATAAVEGLAEGRYLSFEDACLSRAIFGGSKIVSLDEAAMREKAREFVSGPSGRVS